MLSQPSRQRLLCRDGSWRGRGTVDGCIGYSKDSFNSGCICGAAATAASVYACMSAPRCTYVYVRTCTVLVLIYKRARALHAFLSDVKHVMMRLKRHKGSFISICIHLFLYRNILPIPSFLLF